MTRRDELDGVLSSIDGALADDDLPDAMRWSPEPEHVDAPHPFDGDHVPLPPQQYEREPYAGRWVREYDAEHAHDGSDGLLVLRQMGAPLLPPRSAALYRPMGSLTPESLADLRRSVMVSVPRPPAPRLSMHASGLALDVLVHDEPLDPERARRVFAELGRVVEQVAQAFAETALSVGEAIAKFAAALRGPNDPPPLSLRERDPRAYALELRRTRNTGPDRQVQHRPRPRRHQL